LSCYQRKKKPLILYILGKVRKFKRNKFDELFEYGQQATICDYRCENCKRVVKEMKKLTKYAFSNNQYLIVRISNSIIKPHGEEVYFKTKILNFNENCMSIPGDASGTNFKLNSAICFQPTNEANLLLVDITQHGQELKIKQKSGYIFLIP
jgi:hypothetical protein